MGEKMERHTMTGKKRGKKMKAVKLWAVVSKESTAIHVAHTREHARAIQNYMAFPPSWRVTRVLVSEIPSWRGK